MSARCALLLAAGLVANALAAAGGPPLPAWDEVARKQLEQSGWVPGALLLPDLAPDPEPNPLDADKPTPEEMVQPRAPVSPIAEKHLATYFGARPDSYLIDPQHLLSANATRDELVMLENHAADSTVDLFIYVFGKDQEIPGEMRAEELIERFFTAGRPAMIVFYFLEQPEQAVMYLSPSVTNTFSAVEQRRALTSSVMQAAEKADPFHQLTTFTTQMGIQIYWMERLLGDESAPSDATLASHPRPAKQPKKASAIDTLIERWRPAVAAYAPHAGVATAVLAAVIGLSLWWRRQVAYRLPEFEVEPRLGGNHAAGIGAVISFVTPTLPPASQRNQIPEYLRRS